MHTDGIAGVSKPTDLLAPESISLLRLWFYTPGTFILTETVITEVAQIKNVTRRELHDGFINTLFLDYPVRDITTIESRVKDLKKYHELERQLSTLNRLSYICKES